MAVAHHHLRPDPDRPGRYCHIAFFENHPVRVRNAGLPPGRLREYQENNAT